MDTRLVIISQLRLHFGNQGNSNIEAVIIFLRPRYKGFMSLNGNYISETVRGMENGKSET